MSPCIAGRVFVFGTFLLLLSLQLTKAQQKADWTWKDASNKTRTRAELDEILREHRQWIESNGSAGKQADLSGADLRRADLVDADLLGAELDGANLGGQYLYLAGANLTGADLYNADLRNTYLGGADLTDVELAGADVYHAKFEPITLPALRGIAAAKNLEFLTYDDNPDSLVRLRKQFQDAGFRDQERKITYALKRTETERSWSGCTSRKLPEKDKTRAILWSSDSTLASCGSFVLNTVFFDWTCQYGMSPGRPLILGVLLWFLCSVLYFACIHGSDEPALYRVYAPGDEDPSAHRRVERIGPDPDVQTRGRFRQFFWRQWLVLRPSMFFSLMSAFNIGFRDINFGRWLRLLTRQQFDIKAVGWARVVAGWQSLISVYLLALWVLTYFGRPFG